MTTSNLTNGRKLSKPVENTVGKGEIARYEQFLLFPQCFQKACFPGVSKGVIVWEWVKTCNSSISDHDLCCTDLGSLLHILNRTYVSKKSQPEC